MKNISYVRKDLYEGDCSILKVLAKVSIFENSIRKAT